MAERLREALNEGRLTLSEYDDRLRETYAARTYGELKALMTDLPPVAPNERSAVTPASPSALAPTPVTLPPGYTMRWLSEKWSGWLTVSVILTVIWFASGAHQDYWPKWPIGILGAIMLVSTITGLAGGEPRRQAERHARRQAERERRRAAERDHKSRGSDGDRDK